MSLTSLLSIARTALMTSQRAMAVTSHNIANAETPGYSRQRLGITAAVPLFDAHGALGRGVTDTGVSRIRDQFSDTLYRRQSSFLGQANTSSSLLSQIEAAINEPSDTGISAALDSFFNAFNDLANNPESTTNRDLVVSSGDRLAGQIRRLDADIAQTQTDAVGQLQSQISQVNTLTQQISDLNAQIVATGGPDHNAPDLLDQRDLLVDQLSGIMSIQTVNHADGSIGILGNGQLLVDGGGPHALEMRPQSDGTYAIGLQGGTDTFTPTGGSFSALLTTINTTVPRLRGQLDQWTQQLVQQVNALHEGGYTLDGQIGVDFFDPSKVTAGTISLSDAVLSSTNNVAAGGTAAPGDGSVALAIAGLATTPVTELGGATLRDFYTATASSVGVDVQNSQNDISIYQTLVDSADQQRQSVSGVNLDEEMTNLIAQQEAYSAAAKLVTTADEMVQMLLQMV